MPQQFLYKVWLPGQSPTSHEPALTLHDSQAIHFFVEAIANGSQLFLGKPFIMAAYYLVNELMERPVTEGTYQLEQPDAPHLQGASPLTVLYESGIRTPQGELGIISAALIDALASIIKEREQVL